MQASSLSTTQLLHQGEIRWIPTTCPACPHAILSIIHCKWVSCNKRNYPEVIARGGSRLELTWVSDTVPRFWQVEIRKKLLECKGRIRVGPSSDRDKRLKTYIELIQGQVELYVAKNAGIGKVERDFTKGQLAYFVISFNLQGPVANGITFEPQNPTAN